MMKFVTALACASLITCGLQAQVRGSINRGAPKVSNTIEMGGNKLHVDYTSIRFGEGGWKKIKDDASGHEAFNKFAESKPIGNVKTTCEVSAAGRKVPAGEYAMFFTVHERAGWILNLKPKDGEAIRWGMVLKDTDSKSDCLKISLEPSAEADTCSLQIAFGGQQVTVPVTVVTDAEK